jgi:selenium metabolism protein YedF
MACPMPVVTVKRGLEEEGTLRVLLDAGAPVENVTRFAKGRGYSVTAGEHEGSPLLVIEQGDKPAGASPAAARVHKKMVLVTSDRLGDGPEELGRLLLKNFIITLLELPEPPDRIFFINTGVLLTTKGSELLEALEKLAYLGSEIFSCGICLDYFKKRDELAVGEVTNMFTIVESLQEAGSVIRI